jgi:DNA-binding NarL/FixJ family response regulator
VKRIRIFVADFPAMLRDILCRLIASTADMEVVGERSEEGDLADGVAESAADVVLLGCEGAEVPRSAVRLLASRPAVKVFGVAVDGEGAFLYELRPHRTAIGEVSPDVLLERIRTAMGHGATG